MHLPILIEPLSDGRFRARSGEPLPLAAEGTTREEAVAKLRELLQASLANGKELASVQVGMVPPSLPAGAGWLKDDPLFDEWQEAITEYRRKKDEEEGI